jgi:hypothetical protein
MHDTQTRAVIALLSIASRPATAGCGIDGHMTFEPLAESVLVGSLPPEAPLTLPPVITQHIVLDEEDLDT